MFGVGGMLTFKMAENIRRTVSSIPLERLVLETDAPYLAPVPFRGRPNHSRYIPLIAEKLNRGPFGILSKFVKGRHEKLPEITHYEITELQVDGGGCPVELDGEIYTDFPLNCKVIHNGLITFKTAKERASCRS